MVKDNEICPMLTEREKDFVRYWEASRLRRKKVVRQFLIGIPIGLLFVVPIAINFSSGWDRRAEMEANGPDFNPMVLFVALLLIVGFTAIFYQRHRWEQYEQRYQELRLQMQMEEEEVGNGTQAAKEEGVAEERERTKEGAQRENSSKNE